MCAASLWNFSLTFSLLSFICSRPVRPKADLTAESNEGSQLLIGSLCSRLRAAAAHRQSVTRRVQLGRKIMDPSQVVEVVCRMSLSTKERGGGHIWTCHADGAPAVCFAENPHCCNVATLNPKKNLSTMDFCQQRQRKQVLYWLWIKTDGGGSGKTGFETQSRLTVDFGAKSEMGNEDKSAHSTVPALMKSEWVIYIET